MAENALPNHLPKCIFILEIGIVLLEIDGRQSEWVQNFPTCILFARQCRWNIGVRTMIPRIAETIEALNHMELKALKTKTIILKGQCTNQENSRFVFQSRSRHNLIRYDLHSPRRELLELSCFLQCISSQWSLYQHLVQNMVLFSGVVQVFIQGFN